jgi:hypothetical protein
MTKRFPLPNLARQVGKLAIGFGGTAMSNLKTIYWKTFNVVGRVVGVGFILVGAIVLISNATDVIAVVAALITITFGVLLLFAKPYRPN